MPCWTLNSLTETCTVSSGIMLEIQILMCKVLKVAEETKRCNNTHNKIPRHETIQTHSIWKTSSQTNCCITTLNRMCMIENNVIISAREENKIALHVPSINIIKYINYSCYMSFYLDLYQLWINPSDICIICDLITGTYWANACRFIHSNIKTLEKCKCTEKGTVLN